MKEKEEFRLLIASAFVASIVAFITIMPSNMFASAKIALLIPAFILFIYIWLTAAKYKFRNPDEIVLIGDTSRVRKYFYDFGINIYGLTIVGVAFGYTSILQGYFKENALMIAKGITPLCVGAMCWLFFVIIAFVVSRTTWLFKYKRLFLTKKQYRKYISNVGR